MAGIGRMAFRIAFQGERGAYSEEAVWQYWQRQPASGALAEVVPCSTVGDVFRAVFGGEADLGVVPVENSYAGSINETSDLLRQYPLFVRGEVIVRVRHCLMALPGQQLQDITRVYSHPQALAQSAAFLRRHGFTQVAAQDTAGSARLIREQGLTGVAAIAGARAAEIYGLCILARGIEDHPDNQTRFFAIGREPAPRQDPSKTTLIMGTAHEPGALYRCLGAFANKGINLARLESRPSRDRPFEYMFYVDCEGHAEDLPLQEALAELARLTTYLKVLGSFPAAEVPPVAEDTGPEDCGRADM